MFSSKENKSINSIVESSAANTFFRPVIQPKLSINQPNDIYEQEADATADKVMRMPGPSANNNSFFKPGITPIQRKCAHCEEEEKQTQRKESNNETVAPEQAETYINSLNGKGRSLGPGERNFFEPRFGHDFSNVQLHTGSEANQSAKSINALAYTHGNNIVFDSGQYQPDTDNGKKLLAHELTHVVQQTGSVQTKKIQRQDNNNTGSSQPQPERRIDLPAPSDRLSTVLASPEHKQTGEDGAHLGFDFSTSVSPNPSLSLSPQTYAFSLICRNCDLIGGSDNARVSADFGHEPNFQITLSPDPQNARIYQAAFTLINLHFRRNRREFLELGLSPQFSYAAPSGTVSGGAQLQLEWHVTSSFSLTASTSVSATQHSAFSSPDASSLPLGTAGGLDWSWNPISVGALFHFR